MTVAEELGEALEEYRRRVAGALERSQEELSRILLHKRDLEEEIEEAQRILGLPQATTPEPARLHDTMKQVLASNGNQWLEVKDICNRVNGDRLYVRADDEPVTRDQISARADRCSHLFERQGTRIRLREDVV